MSTVQICSSLEVVDLYRMDGTPVQGPLLCDKQTVGYGNLCQREGWIVLCYCMATRTISLRM